MSVQSMRLGTVAPDGRWLYRVSSFSAILFGIAYIIIIALFVPLGAKPKGAEPWLAYIAAHQTAWWAILYLSVLTDFLLVPIALSLYLILQANNRNMMLIACAAVGLFVFLDLALTQINYAAIITLSSSYTAATNDAQRAVFVTAALYSSTVVDSNLLFIYNTFTLSVGILLTGFAMRNGIFGKSTAYIGLTTGLLGVIAVTGAFVVNTVLVTVVASTLTLIWFFFVGFDLYRLSR